MVQSHLIFNMIHPHFLAGYGVAFPTITDSVCGEFQCLLTPETGPKCIEIQPAFTQTIHPIFEWYD